MQIIEYVHQKTPGQNYQAGQVIFQEGEVSNQLFVVVSGSVAIFVKNQIVEVIQEWDFFGKPTLTFVEKRNASVIARTDCQIVPLSLAEFNLLKQYNLPLLNHILKTITSYLQAMHNILPPLIFSQQNYYVHINTQKAGRK